MKKLLLSILTLVVTLAAQAQWSTNPGNPLRVCSKESNQYDPWVFSDGQGGSYIFWTDERFGSTNDLQLVGQHLDANGYRMFPDTGKVLVSSNQNTSKYTLTRDDQGNFLVGWGIATTTRTDSVVIQKFNKSTLSAMWPKTRTVARTNNVDFNILGLEWMQLAATGDSLLVFYQVVWMGGSSVKFVNRMAANGTMRQGNGQIVSGGGYGPSGIYMNADGTFLVIQRDGNGAGAGVTAWKYDRKLTKNWGPNPMVAGTTGLAYAYEIVPDGSGGFIMGWIRSGGDFMATRMDSSGNLVWTPNHKPICDYSSTQDGPDLEMVGGNLYAVWGDSRPPASNTDIYMQKLNLNGDRLWNPNGRIVFRLNSYIPVPKLIANAEGNLIVTSHQSSTGFVAQKVKPDSTLLWPGYGMLIVDGNTSGPYYGNYRLSPGPNGQTFAAWQGSSSARILTASLGTNGTLVAGVEEGFHHPVLRVVPNPASGSFRLDGIAQANEIIIRNLQGKEVYRASHATGNSSLELNPVLPAGVYYLQAGNQQIRLLHQ